MRRSFESTPANALGRADHIAERYALEPCCDWLHVELSPGWQQALSYSPALHQHLLV